MELNEIIAEIIHAIEGSVAELKATDRGEVLAALHSHIQKKLDGVTEELLRAQVAEGPASDQAQGE